MYPDWSDRTVFILGGGPSLKGFDATPLKRHKTIGVNEAGLTLAPWCDILWWSDARWIKWNLHRIHLHFGAYKYTRQRVRIADIPGARYVKFAKEKVDGKSIGVSFSTDPRLVGGRDAGSCCINLAYHTGAKRIVLLGFDMNDPPIERWRDGNWHAAHREPPLANQRTEKFIPAHDRMAARMKQVAPDVEVLNATPGSALTCWPKVRLEDVL